MRRPCWGLVSSKLDSFVDDKSLWPEWTDEGSRWVAGSSDFKLPPTVGLRPAGSRSGLTEAENGSWFIGLCRTCREQITWLVSSTGLKQHDRSPVSPLELPLIAALLYMRHFTRHLRSAQKLVVLAGRPLRYRTAVAIYAGTWETRDGE